MQSDRSGQNDFNNEMVNQISDVETICDDETMVRLTLSKFEGEATTHLDGGGQLRSATIFSTNDKSNEHY